MKYTNTLLIGLTLFILVSCGKTSIEKKWKLDDINVEELLKEVSEDKKEMMLNGVKESLSLTKGKIILDFHKDGTVITENPEMDGTTSKENGTWVMSADKKIVTITVGGRPQDFTIHELSKNKLVIEPKGDKMSLIFIEKK